MLAARTRRHRGRYGGRLRAPLDGSEPRASHCAVDGRSRVAFVAPLALALTVVAGCGPSGPDPLASFAGASLTIQARGLEFAPDIATLPADVPIRLVLDNQDAGIAHNLHVFQGDTDLGTSPDVTGPGLVAIELPPLAPGRYQFDCTLHPDMIGTLLVQVGASAGATAQPGDSAAPAESAPSAAPAESRPLAGSLPPGASPPPAAPSPVGS